MRRSKIVLTQPAPPPVPRGQRENLCDKKGRGTGKKSDYSVYIGQGKAKESDKKESGATKKKVMSPGVPGGMGTKQFDRRITL